MSRTPAFVHGRAPTLAEHNHYVYGELLGMSEAEIDIARTTRSDLTGMRERRNRWR